MVFKAGQSGNPGGKSKQAELQDWLNRVVPKAYKVMEDNLASEDEKIREMAAKFILERQHGKAEQPLVGDDRKPIAVNIIRPPKP